MNEFRVHKEGTDTYDRKKSRGDYVLCINKNRKKQLEIKKFVVVVHHLRGRKSPVKIHCRVIINEQLDDNKIRCDQSIRNALGIPFGHDEDKTVVQVYPLELSILQHIQYMSVQLLGRKHLYLRVFRAMLPDAEKEVVRLPSDAFELLGTQIGNKILLESAVVQEKSKGTKYKLVQISRKSHNLDTDKNGGFQNH